MNEKSRQFILMADDDGDDRLLVQDALNECHMGESVRFVADGEELMKYLTSLNSTPEPAASIPSLILLDLNMPRKDGRQALREIRANPHLRRIPVVVFTTSKADTDVQGLYELGANSFIPKPVAFDSLVKIMQTLGQYWFGIVELPQTATRNA